MECWKRRKVLAASGKKATEAEKYDDVNRVYCTQNNQNYENITVRETAACARLRERIGWRAQRSAHTQTEMWKICCAVKMGWIKKIIYSIWNYTLAPHWCFMCQWYSMTCDTIGCWQIVWKMRRDFGFSLLFVVVVDGKLGKFFGKLAKKGFNPENGSQNPSVLIASRAQKSFMVWFFSFYNKCKNIVNSSCVGAVLVS